MAKRRVNLARGQMNLPFGQEPAKKPRKAVPRKGPSREEKRAMKLWTFNLAGQFFAVYLKRPDLLGNRDISLQKREIGSFIRAYRKNPGRVTYARMRSVRGMVRELLKEMGVKYKPFTYT